MINEYLLPKKQLGNQNCSHTKAVLFRIIIEINQNRIHEIPLPSKITIGLTNGSSTFKRPKALTYSYSYVPRSHAADDSGKAMTMHQSAVSPYGVRDPTAA